MTEDELRTMVRNVVAQHLGQPPGRPQPPLPFWKTHPSHLRLPVASGQQEGGPCHVEPGTACHHCGYCQSLGY